MILDTTSKSIQVVLSAAPATTQASIVASYADMTTTNFVPGNTDLASNGTTAVTAIAAPAASTQRQVKHLSIYNQDTVNMTVTVQMLDTATVRILYKTTLSPGQTLEWLAETGWRTSYLLTANTPDYISGLKMTWVSASSITISGGEAWVPGSNQLASVNAPVTLTGLALGNSVFGHVYVNVSGSFQCVTTAPSAPYQGTARTKNGDTTWRYVGTVLTDASGNIIRFKHNAQLGRIDYTTYINTSPFLVVSGGTATATTTVNCSGCVPITSMVASIFTDNTDTAAFVRYGTSEIGTLSGSNYLAYLFPNNLMVSQLQLDSSQALTYAYSSAPAVGTVGVRVVGYFYER